MNAILASYFLSKRYERDYVIFINVENDIKHAPINAIHATHLNQNFHDD